MRNLILTSAVAASFLAGAVVLAGGSASAGPVRASEERFTNYRQATGPELTAADAAEIAVQRALLLEPSTSQLASALVTGTTVVEVAHGTHAGAKAVEEGESPTASPPLGSDAEQTELLQSAVYIATMYGQFAPNVPTPRNSPLPHGEVMTLVLDAHTGLMTGLQISSTAPDIAALGPVAKFRLGAGLGPGASAATRLGQNQGLLVGNVYRAGKAAPAGWRVVAGSGRRRVITSTTKGGGFVLHLKAGMYTVTALRRDGTHCDRSSEHIVGRHNFYLNLRCS